MSPPDNVDWSCIFVHAGAGYHSQANEPQHLKACALACKAAMALLRNGGSAVDGVEMALRSMEDNEITNSGFGSNLCLDGMVECDASIMEESGRSGAVGAVDSFKNPSAMARLILDNSRRPMSLKRVPPILLAGPGAKLYASQFHFPIISNDELVSHSAHQRWLKWKRELDGPRDSGVTSASRSRSSRSRSATRRDSTDTQRSSASNHTAKAESRETDAVPEGEDLVTDTVGAICVDRWGRVAAGSSSGGIGMKFRGRVGPAALIGVGTWIRSDNDGSVMATTCSGTGEQIVHTMIASKAVERMFESDDEFNGLKIAIEHDFMGSNVVQESNMSSAVGIMAIKFDKMAQNRRIHFSYGHTTDSMVMAYQSVAMKVPQSNMSRNKMNPKACMGGVLVPIQPT